MNRCSVGLVGCGSIATTHARVLKDLADEALLTACADKDPQRAQHFASQHSCRVMPPEELYSSPEIDLIVICTPSGHHAVAALAALNAGKDVLLEKPLETSPAKALPLFEARQRSGRLASVVSQHRFDPDAIRLRNVAASGELGRLFGADIQIPWYRTQEYYEECDWRGTVELDGGCLPNQGIHTLDLMLWIMGPVKRLWALNQVAVHQHIEAYDHVVATLEFTSGAVGNLMCSTAIHPGYPAKLSLWGSNGSAILEGDSLQSLAIQGQETRVGQALPSGWNVATGGTRAAQSTDSSVPQWKWGDAHRAQWRDVLTSRRTAQQPAVTLEDGLLALRVIEAVHQSARTGEVCELD
ncbi:MAG: Gfo/Idh/MocA family protein [Candidatus Methylacidiphilales bacterium]